MNRHLTEQQLIDYQFKLASEAGLNEVRTHLETCAACRRKLEQLARKFASLDLLREEIKASEALVAKTVANAAARSVKRTISLPRFRWFGATAAAVIVGFALLLVSKFGPPPQPHAYPTNAPIQQEEAPAIRAKSKSAGEPEQVTAKEVAGGAQDKLSVSAAAKPQMAPAPTPPGVSLKDKGLARSGPGPVGAGLKPARPAPEETPHGVTTNVPAAAPPVARLGAIEEKPPFAPASAIELVVLPRRDNVQLTIYNAADLTLVRERRNLTLKRGWNWLQFMWAGTLIDPTSLALEPLEHKGEVEVRQLVFPPRLRELGRWLIHSEVSGQVPFEMTYLTSGLSWRAFYMGTLAQDEKTMHLDSYVRVANQSGEDYENAETRLIVGQVHLLDQIAELAKRQYPYGVPTPPPTGMMGGMGGFGGALYDKDVSGQELNYPRAWKELGALRPKEIRKEGLSEYFLYTIEGTETIPNEWGKRLLSLQADDIPVTSLHKYDEERWGGQTVQFLSFANDEEHKLGQTPLPDGMVRIYGRADAEGHLSYVGGTDVKYIPVGEEIELDLGPARLVEVKPELMDYRTENHTFDRDGNVSGWDEVQTWRIEVTNARTLPVEIEVTRGFETSYWSLKQENQGVSYEKYDVNHARFKLTAEPRRKRAFEYTVTTYHGAREQSLANVQGSRK
jgi:hypothetical protein